LKGACLPILCQQSDQGVLVAVGLWPSYRHIVVPVATVTAIASVVVNAAEIA